MAGMLAGVECARRRRLGDSSRSSFCLHHTTISSIEEHGNDKLGEAVREAKQRLHQRLRHRKSETKRVGLGGELEMEGKRKPDLLCLQRIKAALCP